MKTVSQPFSLDGKKIIITGASSGIGRQCALSCAVMGASVILLGRNEKRLRETFQSLPAGNHSFFIQDITRYEELENVIRQAVSATGTISGLIHSAGIEMTVPLQSMDVKKYMDLFSVNVFAGFELARLLSKKSNLDPQGSSFVFIASVLGNVSNPALAGYSASKGALIAGIRSLALELSVKKIRVNCVSPAQIKDTNMTNNLFEKLPQGTKEKVIERHPLGLGTTEDVANACVFLLSPAAKWITGTNLLVDGGYCAQ